MQVSAIWTLVLVMAVLIWSVLMLTALIWFTPTHTALSQPAGIVLLSPSLLRLTLLSASPHWPTLLLPILLLPCYWLACIDWPCSSFGSSVPLVRSSRVYQFTDIWFHHTGCHSYASAYPFFVDRPVPLLSTDFLKWPVLWERRSGLSDLWC